MNGNLRDGQGIFFYITDDVYFGEWKGDLFEGTGCYIFRD